MADGVRVIVVGGGGREHALAWKLAQSPQVEKVYALPGNPGMTGPWDRSLAAQKIACAPVAADDIPGIIAFAKEHGVTLIVPGPELPLVRGIADAGHEADIPVFGPDARAAMATEGSKCDFKKFLARHGIPTAPFRCFAPGDELESEIFIADQSLPVVVKDDGLAEGKGVTIAQTHEHARFAVRELFVRGRHALVEQYLRGVELSFTCVAKGEQFLPLALGRDQKLLHGKMTGGMGVVSSDDLIPETVYRRITETIVRPTLTRLAQEDKPFIGFPYFGLMIVGDEPYVLELNCRLGDPEAQAILPRLWSDLYGMIQVALAGKLSEVELRWDPDPAVAVVIAAAGYPAPPRKGDQIRGLEAAGRMPGVKLFSAAIAENASGELITAGGRVLTVVGRGATTPEARKRAYAAAGKIRLAGRQMVETIGATVG